VAISRWILGTAVPRNPRCPGRQSVMWTAAGWLAFILGLVGEFVWRWPHLIFAPAILVVIAAPA
jgi:hypothetical protein